jgi:hypothetical protein
MTEGHPFRSQGGENKFIYFYYPGSEKEPAISGRWYQRRIAKKRGPGGNAPW